jgi:hypothetical protein
MAKNARDEVAISMFALFCSRVSLRSLVVLECVVYLLRGDGGGGGCVCIVEIGLICSEGNDVPRRNNEQAK